MLTVYCPTPCVYSTVVGIMRTTGIRMDGKTPASRRVMSLKVGDDRWIVFPSDYYAARRQHDGGSSIDESLYYALKYQGIAAYRPENDREYHEGDGDGGIGVLAPVLV